jgi:hypothetical protein
MTSCIVLCMNIGRSSDEQLVKKIQEIVAEREELELSFKRFQFQVGQRVWERADLHARTICRFSTQQDKLID